MSWKRINNGLIPESELMASMALGVNAIEIDQTNSNIVYAGTTKGLFRTTNKGEQWERIGQSLSDPFISSIVLHSAEPSQLYIGGPAGIWKSSDSGKTWQEMNQGFATRNIRALVMDRKNPQLLYAGTNGSGLYRSTDAGATWTGVPLKAAPLKAG
jgi:ligand-binding sensor domain-containing protein